MSAGVKTGQNSHIKLRLKIEYWISTAIQGLAAGAISLVFLFLIRFIYENTYVVFAQKSLSFFLIASFLLIVGTSSAVGLLLSYINPNASGSGIPQIKIAYWKKRGYISIQSTFIKLIAGVLSIGGGQSLGRKAPSVYLGGGIASFLAGRFGIPPCERRQALLSGSAAGLAAAFNCPLAGVAFIIEEIACTINKKVLVMATFSSLAATFLVHNVIGADPIFRHVYIDSINWVPYVAIPIVALVASSVGVFFRRSVIECRSKLKEQKKLPRWLHPVLGGLVTWILGCGVFIYTGRLGVFSLGSHDLNQVLGHYIDWRIAGLLALVKLVATIACYASGGIGGVFAPSLFIGGMSGYFIAGYISRFMPLSESDFTGLALVGMACCLGAVIRAPVTSFLIIFEMTHQVAIIPALLLGTLLSQSIAKLAGPYNFFEDLLLQDGYQKRFIRPTLELKDWKNTAVSEISNPYPITVSDWHRQDLEKLLKSNSFDEFPFITGDTVTGIVERKQVEHYLNTGIEPQPYKVVTAYSDQTIEEIYLLFIGYSRNLLPVLDRKTGRLTGIVTRNDLLRSQTKMMD